jgi:hypothetical protein
MPKVNNFWGVHGVDDFFYRRRHRGDGGAPISGGIQLEK